MPVVCSLIQRSNLFWNGICTMNVPSIKSDLILQMFSNFPVQFSLSTCSFWKRQLQNCTEGLNTDGVWAGAENS